MRHLLLLSGSSVYGGGFLGWCGDLITDFLGPRINRVLFIPYAQFDYDEYTERARERLKDLGYEVDGIHEQESPVQAVEDAHAIFIGGGNTFRLLKELYDKQLLDPIRKRVLQDDIPYLGSSAGSNVATTNICTTNDMPIIHPPSFDALGLVPFNINPHFVPADPHRRHQGETREMRIKEYHSYPGRPLVIALRDGCALQVVGDKMTLMGQTNATVFMPGKEPKELEANSDVSRLLL